MKKSLERLCTLRERLKRVAEAEHARARDAHEATTRDLETMNVPDQPLISGHALAAFDDAASRLWRQEAAQKQAQADSHQRLLHEVGEHKKVEKVLEARAQSEALRAQRREAQVQDAWLRHRLHTRKQKGK